ncbi:hypothetical protein F7Q96_08470 [Cupriavidus gilardii]|uniref:Uncharacterized protein n=1 Tax=Cupriavidus gilardii TaxID=82541 RepID=A0A849B7V0_9BURK|nr:hypothetical protein F7Q96_08470 [Cupriavidus gilardii]NNH10526.1 hypothetical protein [Cupriavidus gilardii]
MALLLPASAFGDELAQRPLQPPDYRLAPRGIGDGVWLLEGANADFAVGNGCNIINTAFIDTGDGVVVVNTGPSRRYGEQQRVAIASVTISGGIAPDLRSLDSDCSALADPKKKQGCYSEIDQYFATTVRRGRTRDGRVYMPPFDETLTQEAVWALKTYLESRRPQ